MHKVATQSHLWQFSSSSAFHYIFCHPASTTLPNLKVSFGSSLCIVRLSLSAFWMTFFFFDWPEICKYLCFCTCCKITAPCLYAGLLLEFYGYRTNLFVIL